MPLPNDRRMKTMMRGTRKSTPQVVKGKVQKKNNLSHSTNYYVAPDPRTVIIDSKRPGVGYKHFLNKRDIYQFLEILPNWNELAVGLNAVVLAPGEWETGGYHVPGVVHVCAWDEEMWLDTTREHY